MFRPVLASLTVVALIAASPAVAAPVGLTGETTVSPSAGALRALSAHGVSVTAVAPATSAGVLRFPIVAGFGDTSTFRGILAHRGALTLSKGGRSVELRRLVAVRAARGSVLLAQVSGRPGGCAHARRAERFFSGRRGAERAGIRLLRRHCRRGRVIVLARLTRLRRSVTDGTAELSAELRLGRGAARLLDRVAGARVLRPGVLLGSATSTVCRTKPCGVTMKTRLGILYPLFVFDKPADIIAEARALGVKTVRLSQDVSNETLRPALRVFGEAGFDLVFTANYNQQRDELGNRAAHPPVGAAALATYRQQLGAILDQLPTTKVVQVENEEVEPRFFAGTMAQYLEELNAAVEVGHARGLPVTNGGITARPVSLLTWQDYRDRGREAQADDFARRAFSRPTDRWIQDDLLRKPFTGLRRQALQTAWDKAKELIPAFRRSQMDYVNFHWYIDDDSALREVVAYLRRATGKTVVTTEIGQHNTLPGVVTGHLTTTIEQLRLPLVVWFDRDGEPALGLHDAPGVLRDNGRAFRSFVDTHGDLLE